MPSQIISAGHIVYIDIFIYKMFIKHGYRKGW